MEAQAGVAKAVISVADPAMWSEYGGLTGLVVMVLFIFIAFLGWRSTKNSDSQNAWILQRYAEEKEASDQRTKEWNARLAEEKEASDQRTKEWSRQFVEESCANRQLQSRSNEIHLEISRVNALNCEAQTKAITELTRVVERLETRSTPLHRP